uniref:hypothetical protein n=1 Tax=Pseudonocardia sp. CA-138482 TaxID=3240023 RepID=UPI003F498A09
MFGDASTPVEIAERFESYKEALNKSFDAPVPAPGAPSMSGPVSPVVAMQAQLASAEVTKALSPEVLESVRTQLAQSDVVKDLNVAGPGSTGGLVAYDLEAPAKLLTPRPTPLRNRIARRQGVGTAHQFKRLTGFTGTGTGGVGLMRPGITESTQNTFGGVSYLRGPKISYAGDQSSVPYLQFSVSDQVSWAAQFAGQGYQDIRQLSQTSVLYSSMLLEERLLLGGRGTAAGFSGALAAPGTLTLTVRTAASNEIGNSANIANLFVRVTATSVWGESVSSAEATTTGLAAATGKVIDITFAADVPGALGYKVYVGTTTGAANCFAAAVANSSATLNAAPSGAGVAAAGSGSTVGGASITVNFTGAGTGGAPSTGATAPTVDSSADAKDYDGMLSYCTGPNAGYVRRINALMSSNPGNEFNVAFAAMYEANKADPDEILLNGSDRKQLSDMIKLNSNSSGYRIMLDNSTEAHNATVGALVSGLQNEVTGKLLDITVHPWLPQGNAPIISWTLPLPDSQVSDVFAAYNVQDYMAIQWPVMQFAYETSSYWYGTFVCFAPAWNGAVQGIFKA